MLDQSASSRLFYVLLSENATHIELGADPLVLLAPTTIANLAGPRSCAVKKQDSISIQ